MGRGARWKQERLPEKLRYVREALGLSQTELLRRLGFEERMSYSRISEYELGKNEPPLSVLLEYARLAGVHLEALVDDDLNLPAQLPGDVNHTELRRKYAAPQRKKK